MPTLRYYDGAAYQPLPGMPGVTGPTGPAGPVGPTGPGWTGISEYWRSQSAIAAVSAVNTGTTIIQDTTIPNLVITARAGVWYRLVSTSRPATDTAAVTMDVYICDGGSSAPTPTSPVIAEASIYLAAVGGSGSSQLVVHQDLQFTAGTHVLGVFFRRTAGTATAGVSLNAAAVQTKDLTVFNPALSGAIGPTGPAGPTGLSGTVVSARVSRVAAYTAPTTAAILTWDTKQWDTQNAYNTSTGLFTAPVTGKYKIESQIGASIAATGGYLTLAIYKNGVAYGARSFSQYTSAATQWSFAQVIDTVDLVVGDTISMFASALVATTLNPGNDLTYFAIDLLSGTGPQGATGPTGPTGPAAAVGQLYSLAYYQTIPPPQVASNPYTVRHGLGTTFPLVQLYDASTLQQVMAQVAVVDANNVAISVTSNMPNSVNVVVMGVAASPVPINPGDLATKAYVDAKTATLPAPVTSGSTIQSFTDVLGDVWVAKAGVRGGNWYRARDVLHCEYSRAAAWTAPTAWTNFTMDNPLSDVYGLYVGGFFAPPIPGLWSLFFQLTINPTATAGIHFDVSLYDNTSGGYLRTNTGLGNATTWGIPTAAVWQGMLTTAFSITCRNLCSAALGGQTTGYSGGLAIAYLGTG